MKLRALPSTFGAASTTAAAGLDCKQWIVPTDEPGFPIIPHEFVGGVDCCGCLVVDVRSDQALIKCNECGAVIRTVLADEAAAVMDSLMMQMASETMCSARCPHCGALNTFPGFSVIDAFVCSACGESVAVGGPLQ